MAPDFGGTPKGVPYTEVENTPSTAAITQWLGQWRAGDLHARDQLFTVVHSELRQLAARLLRRERADHTLEPNAVINELYLRLTNGQPVSYHDRTHFYAVAAQTMRRILVDYARARVADKRGGVQQRVPLSEAGGWAAAMSCE